MFRAHLLIIRRSKLHYTASGIITPICVMIPGGCVMQFWPPDDEHMCSKHAEARNKTYCETFCVSSWLITEINILRCTVSKTSKKILSCFSSQITFIYTKLKLKTRHTKWLNFKNDIGTMTTVILDAVFKPFFLKSSMTRANNWRSIGRNSWRMASFKSLNTRGVVSVNTRFQIPPPQKKIRRWKIGRARGPRHVSETGNEVPGKHVSNSGHWLVVCTVHCGTVLMKSHIGLSPQPPRPTYWVLPIQKMSGSRRSPVWTAN